MDTLRRAAETAKEKRLRAAQERQLEGSYRPVYMGEVISQATDTRLHRAAAARYGVTNASRFKTVPSEGW